MEAEGGEIVDFPVLLTSSRTLSIAGRCETLLTAGRRKVAVVEVVVLGTVRPGELTQSYQHLESL